jgi:hypothetical protein
MVFAMSTLILALTIAFSVMAGSQAGSQNERDANIGKFQGAGAYYRNGIDCVYVVDTRTGEVYEWAKNPNSGDSGWQVGPPRQ